MGLPFSQFKESQMAKKNMDAVAGKWTLLIGVMETASKEGEGEETGR